MHLDTYCSKDSSRPATDLSFRAGHYQASIACETTSNLNFNKTEIHITSALNIRSIHTSHKSGAKTRNFMQKRTRFDCHIFQQTALRQNDMPTVLCDVLTQGRIAVRVNCQLEAHLLNPKVNQQGWAGVTFAIIIGRCLGRPEKRSPPQHLRQALLSPALSFDSVLRPGRVESLRTPPDQNLIQQTLV